MLTPQQEKFCKTLAGGTTQADAYRKAFPNSLKWKDSTVHSRAYELNAKGEISARVKELQNMQLPTVAITRENLVQKLLNLHDLAVTNTQITGGVSAVMGAGKLLGMVIDKAEVKAKVEMGVQDFAAFMQGWPTADRDAVEKLVMKNMKG